MSSGTNAHPARAGFNQSGGAYFVCLTSLEPSAGTATIVQTLSAVGSNSGGAWVAPTLVPTTMSNVLGPASVTSHANAVGIVAANKLIKDMGRTVVSSGRTFRKFAPVAINASGVSTFGVTGSAGTTTNAGYGSFYLEVGREGVGSTPAPIARYF